MNVQNCDEQNIWWHVLVSVCDQTVLARKPVSVKTTHPCQTDRNWLFVSHPKFCLQQIQQNVSWEIFIKVKS